MTLTIELTPEQEAKLAAAARRQKIAPQAVIQKLVTLLPPAEPISRDQPQFTSSVDPENDASIALLNSWLAEDATDDPSAIKAAEEDLAEFKRNMNAPRKEAGARLLFPEAE